MAFKRILLRRDTSSNWTSGNAVLASGEIGYETNTGKFKIGNGSTAWTSLAYSITTNLAASVLNDLGDVTITSAANGDFLRWNGSAWINDAVDLATDTIGSFVQSLVAGTGVTLSNNSGENATPTVAVDTTVIAPIASPTFTGTVSGVTATMVGLGSVNNTTDANKPVSTATQTALDLKSNLASPSFSGTVTAAALTVSGNLTVSGTTTSINTETLTVDDNIIVLNNNVTASPTENAGIEVERGSSTNVSLLWDEITDKWQLTNDGTTYSDIATASSVATATTLSLDNLTDATIVSAAAGQFLKYNGSAWVNDAIDLTTDTVGDYVATLTAGTGITLANNSGEGASPTVTVDTTVIQAKVTNVTDTEIGYLDGVTSAIQTQIDLKAPLASPTFTGTPAAPTATVGTSTTQVATTAFVFSSVDNDQFVLAGQVF